MKVKDLRNKLVAIATGFMVMFALPTQAQTLNVGGTTVTSTGNVTGGWLHEGSVHYDASSKTLTLDNAVIQATTGNDGIKSSIDGLTIKVLGTCSVTSDRTEGIKIHSESVITGGGTLTTKGRSSGISMYKAPLTISECTVNAMGTWGIAGYDGNNGENLRIIKANVTAKGDGNEGSICDIASLTTEDCSITEPVGAAYDATLKGVALNGTLVKEKVVIEVIRYGLKIAGVDVTSVNCNDLSVIDGVSGTAKYDPDSKTLILEDATIDVTAGRSYGIVSDINGLTIKVSGECSVSSPEVGIVFHKTSTITGGGTLKVAGVDDHGIFMYQAPLTISNCTVNVKGKYGITGWNGNSGEHLRIINAIVTAQGNGSGASIWNIASFTTEGCKIVQPRGAAYSEELKGIAIGSALVTDPVVIKQLETAIDAISTDAAQKKQGIYNLQGVRMTNDMQSLPAGVYIKNGKKVVIK